MMLSCLQFGILTSRTVICKTKFCLNVHSRKGCLQSAVFAFETRLSSTDTGKRSKTNGRELDMESEGKYEIDNKLLRQDLNRIVFDNIRQYLRKYHGEIFDHRIVTHRSLAEILKKKGNKESKERVRNSIELLARLNGYYAVPKPQLDDFVGLAQGVIARPKFHRFKRNDYSNYMLFAHPMDECETHLPTKKAKKIPVLVEKDVTIYRLLEDLTAQMLVSIATGMSEFLRTRVNNLLNFLRSEEESSEEKLSNEVMPKSSNTEFEQKTNNKEENLLVVTDDSMLIVKNLKPSHRLLALPHDLRHKGASTLISVSLVVFGAVPAAFRSVRFAFDYPALSNLIAASVVGTISYGIWSSRANARTNQSRVVAQGISYRIFARDTAALMLLQEKAVAKVTDGVLSVYDDALQKKAAEHKVLPGSDVINPVELALQLGLIERSTKNVSTRYIAFPVEVVMGNLTTQQGFYSNQEKGDTKKISN